MAYVTDSNAFTEDTTLMADWRSDDLTGKQVTFTYWMPDKFGGGRYTALRIDGYSPELEGKILKYMYDWGGVTASNEVELINSNIGVILDSTTEFEATPITKVEFHVQIDGYSKYTIAGTASGARRTYTLSK